jgi:hypothetical protein
MVSDYILKVYGLMIDIDDSLGAMDEQVRWAIVDASVGHLVTSERVLHYI